MEIFNNFEVFYLNLIENLSFFNFVLIINLFILKGFIQKARQSFPQHLNFEINFC